jgi:hypothetical protein
MTTTMNVTTLLPFPLLHASYHHRHREAVIGSAHHRIHEDYCAFPCSPEVSKTHIKAVDIDYIIAVVVAKVAYC